MGSYTYVSNDPGGISTDHNLDHLVLQSDGQYDLIQVGTTKPSAEKMGLWHFYGGDRPTVDLDHAGYPVRIEHGKVRLLVDDDVGIWWVKAK